mgnify:CR=1 FL=1|tara:strand:+ start:4691 stop:5608 length:918 start_codon:yes stop_codon:yes gene_type:complete
MKKIRIGARGSHLSQVYVQKVKSLIIKKTDISENDVEIFTIKTSGDIYSNKKLSDIGGKKLFCKEIEDELLSNKIDIAVHSLKDMESEEHRELIIGAYLKRNDPRDVLLSKKIKNLNQLKLKAVIGSSSRRRELQLKKISKEIKILNMRGNVDTRVNKLDQNNFDGIILAAAGIKSLNLEHKISFFFETKDMIPAVGQGVIATQCRQKDEFIKNILREINDEETKICANAERSMLKTIGGDCDTAVGGFAFLNEKKLTLVAELYSDDGMEFFNCEKSGQHKDAIIIGKTVGEELLKLAGDKFKKK